RNYRIGPECAGKDDMANVKETCRESEKTPPALNAHMLLDSSLISDASDDHATPDRHLLFTGPDLDIHLKVTEADRHRGICGQVITHQRTQQSATIVLGGDVPRKIETGTFGEFNFEEVPAGNVFLEILLPSRR